jgi:uncharacterized membrane protein YhaH (DUF805 family)
MLLLWHISVEVTEFMICRNCGTDNLDTFVFCSKCGCTLMTDGGTIRPERKNRIVREQEGRRGGFNVLSASGRLNRLKYFYTLVMFSLGASLSIAGCLLSATMESGIRAVAVPAFWVIYLFLYAVMIIATVKRFHDINSSGTNFFLLLIPIYSILIEINLLFFKSIREENTYEETEGNGHYWQTPLIMALIPAVFLGACIHFADFSNFPNSVLSTYLPAQFQTGSVHYYDKQYQVSIDFPAGWVAVDLTGYRKCATKAFSMQTITLDVSDTDKAEFSEYTDTDFANLENALRDKDKFAANFKVDAASISDISCSYQMINGKRFELVEMNQVVKSVKCRHFYLMGIYNSELITVQIIIPVSEGQEAIDIAMASAETLRIGSDALPAAAGSPAP